MEELLKGNLGLTVDALVQSRFKLGLDYYIIVPAERLPVGLGGGLDLEVPDQLVPEVARFDVGDLELHREVEPLVQGERVDVLDDDPAVLAAEVQEVVGDPILYYNVLDDLH